MELEAEVIQELRQENNFKLQEILPFTTIDDDTYQHETVNHFESAKRQCDQKILMNINNIKEKYPKYGYRSVTKELHRLGFLVNHKRVLRLMKENNLICNRS